MEAAPITQEQLAHLFKEQQKFLNAFFDNLEYGPIEAFCKECLGCRGTLLFTGVGKSGFIAQKVCQTLVSTGTKAVYLSPTDALHGDIGIVGREDLVVLVSKSGATEELLRLVPYAKAKGARLVAVTSVQGCHLSAAKGARLVAVTSVQGCRLSAVCDLAVHLPLERELCPFDLAPVTSTAAQMLFGDTVAIALMQAKRLTQEDFAMNHPAGRIGKRLILKVHDVMLTGSSLPLIGPDVLIMEALGELSGKALGCLLVVGTDGKLLGTFTDGDLRRTLQSRGAQVVETKINQVMHSRPRTCSSHIKAVDAMLEMERPPRKVTFFPVEDDGQLVGLVTLHGLVSAGL